MAHQAWDVWLENEDGDETLIDTVFWDVYCNPGGALITSDDVYWSLINHDGYDPRISVRKPGEDI